MEFYKPPFWAFLAAAAWIYWSLPGHRSRLLFLLAASAVFYAAFSPWFLVILLASTTADYVVALYLPSSSAPVKRLLVGLSVALNLGVLCFFKYLAFALDSSRTVAGWLGWDVTIPAWRVALPLGISFYTFEAISYVVDVASGKAPPIRAYRDYLLYLLFFPHLMAGPIVRTGDFAPQLHRPKKLSWMRIELGAKLFLLGLFKKAVLADRIAAAIDPVFASPAGHGWSAAWLAAIAYPLQVYGDFSGYSDMALGAAHIFGFKLPANFRQPYFATSIGEYWRRWHVTLSSWLRDYLYHPLGGSKFGLAITLRNLMIVMTLAGLWHGAKWTMVAWGALHGALLCLERLVPLPRWASHRSLAPVFALTTYLTVSLGLVMFRCETFQHSGSMLQAMFTGRAGMALPEAAAMTVLLGLALVLADHAAGALRLFKPTRQQAMPAPSGLGLAAAYGLVLFLIPETNAAFMYFQF
jgi:alginate O-acetyltransferase complex protein AlgI